MNEHHDRDPELASAIATISGMRRDLADSRELIGQLKADLRAEQNKSALCDEERRLYRSEAQLLRSKLVELATLQSNIGLLTRAADEITKIVHETLEASTAPVKARLLDDLERELHTMERLPINQLVADADTQQFTNTLEALSGGARADS